MEDYRNIFVLLYLVICILGKDSQRNNSTDKFLFVYVIGFQINEYMKKTFSLKILK